MEKAENLENHLKRIRGTGLDLDEVPGSLKVDKIKRPRVSKEKIQVTQVCGSMKAKKV